jgi:uncharacterized membrane protein
MRERLAARRAKQRAALALGARVLLVGLGLLPLLPPLLHRVPALSVLADACERWFTFQCQRDPQRVLYVLGQPLPVCARCTGIYFGLGAGALLGRPRLEPRALRTWVTIASALMLLDVLSEALGLRPAWAPLRVFSGALLAYPVGVAVVASVARCDRGSEAVFEAD